MHKSFFGLFVLTAFLPYQPAPMAAPARRDIVRLDLGCPHSTVQPGWTAWAIGPRGPWNEQGPFSIRVDHAAFDPDGFTVTLGPTGAIGYRSGPACKGSLGAVIEEVPFARAAKPFVVTLSGLAAGTYRVITWHNDSRGYKPAAIDLLVTDATRECEAVVEGLAESGVRDSGRAATTDFFVRSDGRADVQIAVRIAGPPNRHAALNGIEIIGGDAVRGAFGPTPYEGEAGVAVDTRLGWRPAPGASRHQVFLGMGPQALASMGDAATTTYVPKGGLRHGQTYYWRVAAAGARGSARGPVWRFTTEDGKARHPVPAVAATDVARAAMLGWKPGAPGARHTVRLGLAPEALAPIATALEKPTCPAGRLELGRTYYWRVDEAYGSETLTGQVWSFTVESGAAKSPQPADREGYVEPTAVLCWAPVDPAARHHVYFGASPDALARVVRQRAEAAYAPKGLELGRTYYWRVDEAYGDRTVAGPVWSFTVGDWRTRGGPPRSKTASIARTPGAWTGGYEKPAAAGKEADLRADVCVVGGGSGGIGAAVAAARAGASVIVVEREPRLGGTSTQAYVTIWAPGPGCPIAREIHDRLAKIPGASKCADYNKTLSHAVRRGVGFELEPFCQVVDAMLAETGRCRVLLNTSFVEAETHVDGGRVWAIRAVSKAGAAYRIRAGVFIDCTGGAYLCQAAGCEVMLGEDAKSRFGEPSAREKPRRILNAMILGYRIRRSANPKVQPPVPGLKCRGGYAFDTPNGEKLVNPCGGMMEGADLIERGYPGAMAECQRRVRAHWHWMQKTQYSGWELVSVAPMLGIRESYRVVGEYVLREQDVIGGLSQQRHPDIIAIADHSLDTHGAGGVHAKVPGPYGIPYRCLVPKGGWTNLLVACRGASFSHIAASSCRLSRTIMQLGHAAGLAAAQAVRTGRGVGEVDVAAIQQQLDMPPR